MSLGWLRRLIGLPDTFEGVIYDTASIATMHALAAAREAAIPAVRAKGLAARSDVPRVAVYCSDQTHSSIDKAVIAIGLGHESLRKIPSDDRFAMRIDALRDQIARDRADGVLPIAVVPTVGTTSTTSIDPVPAVADVCERERLWMHVDAAYGGVAAMLPSHRHVLAGAERADSVVVNPHKWLFTPFDLTAFYCRRMDVLRSAFALTPEYLQTRDAGAVKNLMDTGVQLGRRFRSLKLWMILRSYGAAKIRAVLAEHMRLARELAAWVDAHHDFERLAAVPFSVVCFRWRPATISASAPELDAFNERLVDLVNSTGDVFLSHTRLRGRLALRIAIGHLKTTYLTCTLSPAGTAGAGNASASREGVQGHARCTQNSCTGGSVGGCVGAERGARAKLRLRGAVGVDAGGKRLRERAGRCWRRGRRHGRRNHRRRSGLRV